MVHRTMTKFHSRVTPSGLTFVPVLFNDEMEKIGVHVLTAEHGMNCVAFIFPRHIYSLSNTVWAIDNFDV